MSEHTQVTERAVLIRANNPSPMTLDGTNSYVLRSPNSAAAVVVDPGPLDEEHLQALHNEATAHGGHVALILFTHWHEDHTASVDRFCELSGAPARAFDPAFCRSADPVQPGEVIDVDGLRLQVLFTPGHTMDSVSVLLTEEGSLLSGDTVLGSGTTVIAHPDGKLAPYLESLHHLKELTEHGNISRILPGHGPVVTEPFAVLDGYIAHRLERLQQVRDAVDAGDTTARQVVERVYANVDRSLWQPAEWSVRAQMEYLGVKE